MCVSRVKVFLWAGFPICNGCCLWSPPRCDLLRQGQMIGIDRFSSQQISARFTFALQRLSTNYSRDGTSVGLDWPWEHGSCMLHDHPFRCTFSLSRWQGMCKNLVEKGSLDKPLLIFNRTRTRSTDLISKLPSEKSTVASSLDEAVSKSDVIFTCLGDDAAT